MFSHFVRKLGTLGSRPDPSAVRTGGLIWHPLPAAVELLPPLPTLFTHPSAVVVKQNQQRTILRVPLPGGAVFVKRSRANTPRAWAREILRPPKARLEFENAVRLRALGLPCAEPLAWAEADSLWPGESAVVTREVAGAVPLDGFLSDGLVSAERRAVAVELGRLFARMHAAGVAHPDPHPGNFLVRWHDAPRFVLLDVHSVRFGPPLTWPEARDNLVLFNRWFQLRASRTDRARFWAAYLAAERPSVVAQGVSPGKVDPNGIRRGAAGERPTAPAGRSETTPNPGLTPWATTDGRSAAKQVELLTAASNRRFWANRGDRYLGNNRQFRQVKGKGVRGHAVRELPDELVREWLANPDAVFSQPDVTVLKDSRSSTVVLAGGVLWKRFRLKKPLDAWKNLVRQSQAVRSWLFGHGLIDRHLPTARLLFVAHRYRRGCPAEGYVVFEWVPDAVGLPEYVATASFAELRSLAEVLGRLIRTLHDRGVSHRDLKAPNVLLAGPDRRPVFIDLVGLTVHVATPERFRWRDLARLNAGFGRSAAVSRTVRLRVLRAYLSAWPQRTDDWKACWRRIATTTAAKVSKNERTGRPLA